MRNVSGSFLFVLALFPHVFCYFLCMCNGLLKLVSILYTYIYILGVLRGPTPLGRPLLQRCTPHFRWCFWFRGGLGHREFGNFQKGRMGRSRDEKKERERKKEKERKKERKEETEEKEGEKERRKNKEEKKNI